MAENREDDAVDTESNQDELENSAEETTGEDGRATDSNPPDEEEAEVEDSALESSAEDDAPEISERAPKTPPKGSAKSGVKESDGPSAGQRLAATMAAKSARKAAKRGKEAVATEAVAEARAEELAEWMKTRGKGVWVVLAAALAAVAAVLGWTIWRNASIEKAGRALSDAVKVASAPIDADGSDDTAIETFPSAQARAEKTLALFRRVTEQHEGTDAARWARLGEATSLLALGRKEDAKRAFETAQREAGDIHAIAARAIEGIAFVDEAGARWPEATRQYEALARLHNGAYKNLAEYHLGRIYLAQGDTERAKTTLKALLDRMAAANTESHHESAPYAQLQAELRLSQIDPSLVPRSINTPIGSPSDMQFQAPGGGGDISQEELQRLIEQIQKKQQGGR